SHLSETGMSCLWKAAGETRKTSGRPMSMCRSLPGRLRTDSSRHRFDQGMEMMPRKIVYWAHEKTSHTTRKTVAKRKIPRRVPSESSARDPAIQAIATENDTAKSIVTTDTQARTRIVSR